MKFGRDVGEIVGRDGSGGYGVYISFLFADDETVLERRFGYKVAVSIPVDHTNSSVTVRFNYAETNPSWFAILSYSFSNQCPATNRMLVNKQQQQDSSPSLLPPVSEPGMDADDSASFYCLSRDYPCEEGKDFVHVCHYSARLGYQTFCIPEADSEVLRFYAKDYCGPCVGGGSFSLHA